MSWIYLAISSLLALAGLGAALLGIIDSRWQPFVSGLVMLLAAGVFAVLFVGLRWRRVPSRQHADYSSSDS